MLTEEEKTRIRAEEIFRREIQQQISKVDTRKLKWWDLFNSALFLWLMSTIIVGIISFGYTRWERKREDQRRRDEETRSVEAEKRITARKLDAEISNRLYFFGEMMKWSPNRNEIPPDAIIMLGQPSAANYPINVFPEFANRNLQSLLWELQQVAPEGEKTELLIPYEVSKSLSSMFLMEKKYLEMKHQSEEMKGQSESMAVPPPSPPNIMFQIKELNLPRWGKPLAGL